MRIFDGKTYRDMTADEIEAMQEEQAKAESEEKHRPFTESEVTAMLIRQQINTLPVDDQTALRMREFYPEWEAGRAYTEGYKVQYGDRLFKIVMAHTSQADWTPDVAVTLYTIIDEQHDGSKYDPIPYSGNMALSEGLYYVQDGVTYLCVRDTGIPVYNALSELVGLYVDVVQ